MSETAKDETTGDKFIRQCIEEAIQASARGRERFPAHREYATVREREEGWAPYLMHLHAELWYSCMAHILTRVQEVDPALASKLAAESTRYLDDGAVLGEFMWQWGAERGLDPETLFEEARARYAEGLDNPLTPRAEGPQS